MTNPHSQNTIDWVIGNLQSEASLHFVLTPEIKETEQVIVDFGFGKCFSFSW